MNKRSPINTKIDQANRILRNIITSIGSETDDNRKLLDLIKFGIDTKTMNIELQFNTKLKSVSTIMWEQFEDDPYSFIKSILISEDNEYITQNELFALLRLCTLLIIRFEENIIDECFKPPTNK